MKQSFFALILLAAGLSFSCATYGWGYFGHRTSGYLAELELTPTARAAVVELLEQEDFGLAPIWADEVRPDRDETVPWHYINAPRGQLEPDHEHLHPEGGSVYSAILDHAAVVADARQPRLVRQESLKFLMHFIGDIHQPLHTGYGDDRGGNDFFVRDLAYLARQGEPDEPFDLHGFWDTGAFMEENARYTPRQYGAILHHRYAAPMDQQAKQLVPMKWLAESRRIIFAGLYPETQARLITAEGTPMALIDDTYRSIWEPVAEQRLALAGLRMGQVLNRMFDPEHAPASCEAVPCDPFVD